MNLATLFERLPTAIKKWTETLASEVKDKSFHSLCTHHQKVQAQDLFIAIRGSQVDAHDHLKEVAQQGPCLIVCEREVPGLMVPQLVVPSTRLFLAELSAAFFSHPSREMFCYGVTGTNGKTSSTYMMAFLLDRLSLPCGVIGTIEHRLREHVWPTTHTTPDPLKLQQRLREMRSQGASALAMEVSSHALDQERVAGMHWDVAMFTNLTQDHLDYHGGMESYFRAKEKLFTEGLEYSAKAAPLAVVNIDQQWGARLRVSARAEVLTYGLAQHADFQLASHRLISSGRSYLELNSPWGIFRAEVPIVGVPFLLNLTGVIAAAHALGVSPQTALQAMAQFSGVPGRFQRVTYGGNKNVFVDYAHTPDALERILQEGRRLAQHGGGRLVVVFGCGGDRDRGKRPLMGSLAVRLADEVFVTSDNARSEDPEKIIAEIVADLPTKHLRKITDRRQAIAAAIAFCTQRDFLFILGKGHEREPFSDYEVAQKFLEDEVNPHA